jgi:catalase-peroxidase
MENPKELEVAFAKAWFKLTHRDMGPKARYVGKDAPKSAQPWQDPITSPGYTNISSAKASEIKYKILRSGLSVGELIRTSWASAASYRGTDMRGGANGARLRLAPQKNWEVNNPAELKKVLGQLEKIHQDLIKGGTKVSFADLIVLSGAAAIEKAAKDAGINVQVPFQGGRGDATQAQTDEKSFAVLEPKADGFRNYYHENSYLSPINAMIDRANLLNLTVPQMTALVGGLRVLSANHGSSKHGVFTNKVGVLTNDYFVNLLDMSTMWEKSSESDGLYNGVDRKTGKPKWTATPVDLMFGSSSELRAIAEVYAANDGKKKFVNDFISAWTKIMRADRF